jgi:hypothetical protein
MVKLITTLLAILLSACTIGTFKVTEPKTGIIAELYINSLWSDVKLDGLTCTVNKDGSRTFIVDSFGDKTSAGQESFNKMLPGLVGMAVEGAVKGAGKVIVP